MTQIAIFGKISVGKSALLNALFATDHFTVDPRGGSTTVAQKIEVEVAGTPVTIVDTPGIADAASTERAAVARTAAQAADLVIAVCDKDLTETEYQAITHLAHFGKPLLVVLNKADALNVHDRHRLVEQIRRRLVGLVHEVNVLVCAADPIKRYAREASDGTLHEWTDRAQPDVAQVRNRIIEILQTERYFLRDLTTISDQIDTSANRLARAKANAEQTIEEYALGIAVGVAINPVPLLDLFGGGAALVVLVRNLAQLYEVSLSGEQVQALVSSFVTEGWKELWPAVLPIIGGALLKSIPFIGWAIGALGQAVGAYYITYVIGQACSAYFAANQRWPQSMRATLRMIISNTDRNSVSRRAAILIQKRLKAVGR
jgi:small GTP-binding protein